MAVENPTFENRWPQALTVQLRVAFFITIEFQLLISVPNCCASQNGLRFCRYKKNIFRPTRVAMDGYCRRKSTLQFQPIKTQIG